MARLEAEATQMVDDSRVRVTRFDFPPGAETGWHTHAHDYVITAITDCFMRLEMPDGGESRVMINKGAAYRREKGVSHNVINESGMPMSFVEVEIKQSSTLGSTRVRHPRKLRKSSSPNARKRLKR